MSEKSNQLFSNIEFFDYNEMIKSIEVLAERYSFLDFQYLGNSILGKSIPLLKIGNGKREFLYIGAHHGMEWITSMLLCRFLCELCDHYEKNTSVYNISMEALFQTNSFYLIPMLNPDGVEYQIHGIDESNPLFARVMEMNDGKEDFSHWQANARGVDLNHNYDAGFSEYKKLELENKIEKGAPTRYSGIAPESEPEVSALCNFIRFHDNLRGIMTLHTQGEEIFYKSGDRLVPHSRAVAKRLSLLSGYRLSEAEGLASYGGLTDWCVQKLNLPSFTIECGYGTNPLPISDFFSIYSNLRKMFFTFPTLL